MAIAFRNMAAQVIRNVTGTGATQEVKHSLGTTPSMVIPVPVETGVVDMAVESRDAAKVEMNITNTKKVDLYLFK